MMVKVVVNLINGENV